MQAVVEQQSNRAAEQQCSSVAVEEIIKGYREDFFESLDAAYEYGIIISAKLATGEQVGLDEWQIFGLYVDVCKIRMDKLLKCLNRAEQ